MTSAWSNCASAALAIISSVSPVESESRWRWRSVMWTTPGINHFMHRRTSSAPDSAPTGRLSDPRGCTARLSYRQAGDCGEKHCLTLASCGFATSGGPCSPGEKSGKGALSPVSTGPTDYRILFKYNYLLE